MPSIPPSRRALSRRTALLGAVALGAAGCTPYSPQESRRRESSAGPIAPAEVPRVDPDVPLAASVLSAEQAMVDLVDATVTTHPRLAHLLDPTRAVHTAHIGLLAHAVPGSSATPSASASSPSPSAASPGSPSATPSPRTYDVPQDRAKALRQVAREEDALSLADKRSAFAAESGAFARVLASMAAAAAQQAAVLRSAELPGRGR